MAIHSQRKEKSINLHLLKRKWYNGIEEAGHGELEQRFVENADLFEQLAKIIRQKVDANARSRRSLGSYDKPAYSEFQADCNGYERALEEVLLYLKTTKET